MPKTSIIKYIKQINHPVFSTRELCDISGKSASVVTQSLNLLAEQGVVYKLYRGIWGEISPTSIYPLDMIPHLFKTNRVYVSFLTALHMHGIIEQIPQGVTLASTAHSKTVKTALGTFILHRISPEFFFGFEWYKGTGKFLIAEPEKALADSLYLYTRKKKQYGHFPELNLKKPFDKDKARAYVMKIPDKNARSHAFEKLKELFASY